MAALTLRTLTNTGDTTKGSPLTSSEIDQNFINLDTELATKAASDGATLTNVDVNSGTIDGTTVGSTTRAAGAFTTLAANGATTFTDATASTSTATGAVVVTGGVGVGGRVTANDFVGDGSGLTNIDAGDIAVGTLPIARGGTNGTATPTAGAVAYGTGTAYAFTAAGTTGQVLTSNGTSAPTWGNPSSGVTLADDNTASTFYPVFAAATGALSTGYIDSVTTPLSYTPSTGTFSATVFSGSGASLTSLVATQLTSGTVPGARGVAAGSSSSSFLTYSGTSATASQMNGGTTAPTGTTRLNYEGYLYATRFYGDGSNISALSASNVSTGTLAVARGGTNGTATPTAGAVPYGTGTAYAFTAAGTTGQVLTSNGASAPTWADAASGVTLSNDVSTNANTYYPVLANAQTSGSMSAGVVSSTKLYYNPSTGTMNATSFNTLSDQTLKENVRYIDNAVDTVNSLSGVSFTWKENGRKSYGVIAQDLAQVLPDLVEGDDVKTVNYAGIIAFLINAVQELDARVKELEGK